jgi:Tol biopolymer transport system component
LIACGYRGQQNAPWKLAVISLEGQETKYFDLAPSVPLPIVLRWMSDSREVTYIDTNGGVSNIWKQSINGGPPRKLTDFASDQIFAFDWSPTGKQFAYSRGVAINDVVMITDSNR